MNSYDKILSFKNNFYKQLYEDGIQQRNQINNKFTPTITILTAETTATIWCVLNLVSNINNRKDTITLHQLILFLFLSIGVISLILAFVNFILCFTRYQFLYPDPEKIKSYIENNISCLSTYSGKEVLDNIQNEISDKYIVMAIENCKETNKHIEYLNKCYRCIITTLALLLVNFILIIIL